MFICLHAYTVDELVCFRTVYFVTVLKLCFNFNFYNGAKSNLFDIPVVPYKSSSADENGSSLGPIK